MEKREGKGGKREDEVEEMGRERSGDGMRGEGRRGEGIRQKERRREEREGTKECSMLTHNNKSSA